MLNYKELQDDIKPGEHIQIITGTFNGGVGVLKKITTTYIQVDPFVEEEVNEDIESLGTINHTIIFPIEEVKILIRVNMEVKKDNATETI
jgi:hypothetical protein